MKHRASLQDIANEAGISKAAVSMALRNHTSISAHTRARVFELARKMNYTPDPVLSRVASQRWHRGIKDPLALIALIYHDKSRRHPDSWIEPATKQAKTLGYNLEVFEASDYSSPEHLSDVLINRGVSGVIIEQVYRQDFSDRFDFSKFTTVAAHLGHYRLPIHLVTPDRWQATLTALQEVSNAGYSRVAVAFLDEPGAIDFRDKLSATLYAKSEIYKSGTNLFIERFRLDQQSEFNSWVRKIGPQAMIGFNNTIHAWLKFSGIKIPSEIAFVSLETSASPTWGEVVSGVCAQDGLVIQTAVELLDTQLRTNQTGIPERQFTVLVEGTWIEGSTFLSRKDFTA